ncbi:MAG: hypothetical protein ACLPGW_01415 [Roseiarcus sp.]
MDIDSQIARVKELIAKREEIDEQLAALFGGASLTKKARRCKICDGEGHNASTCPERPDKNPTP